MPPVIMATAAVSSVTVAGAVRMVSHLLVGMVCSVFGIYSCMFVCGWGEGWG